MQKAEADGDEAEMDTAKAEILAVTPDEARAIFNTQPQLYNVAANKLKSGWQQKLKCRSASQIYHYGNQNYRVIQVLKFAVLSF